MSAITVEQLTKEFGDVTAVDELSFTVESGELFGLLGPNGAGKSTLIKMLVTLLRPTAGTATVNGHDIHDERSAVRDSLGIVFQEPALDDELTGAENLALHGRLYGQRTDERNQRIDEVLDLIDLQDERDELVEHYSGGMKRRLEIGRGLMHEPSVLFLDEPTVGLDARARRDTWEYIQKMNAQSGISIVLTTHYIEEAEQLCDRVAIVDDGEIVALDSPAELKSSLGGDVVTLALESDDSIPRFCDHLETASWVTDYTTAAGTVHVTLTRGESRIVDLVHLADDADVRITSIDLHKPNLESVFLSVTGRTFDEREGEGEVKGKGKYEGEQNHTASADSPRHNDAATSVERQQ
ncbi:ABC transporter ATP-binding protein [Natrialba hulunbeirensis JCM 10989]|uniref:ABC transporter ATP-binding protein n=1 Tax=Natrialba hulunbeirensis JCM 10989 TaxID=1227493 RepID=M0A376_9EURY|nr:daunorubicin resistance protein DrrA family ABC transporter ATP-binding protein [Natrialba hulunbeirensis]ELY92322.1 ABC transporter ATP-binding protein [Natrialba hulunbeirensis JCM 10989]